MRKLLIVLAFMLVCSLSAAGQVVLQTVGVGVPTGYCNNAAYRDEATGRFYDCINNAWHDTGMSLVTVNSPLNPSNITQDATHRFSSDAEKAIWNAAGAGGVPPTRTVNGHPLSADVTVTKADVGLPLAENTSDAGKPISTATQTALNLKANLASIAPVGLSGAYTDLTGKPTLGNAAGKDTGTAAGTVAAGDDSRITGATNASNLTSGTVAFARGGRAGSAAAPATTGAMTVSMTTAVVTITPTGAATFNASGGTVGQTTTFIVTTSGVASFVLTWGTNFVKTGTLATGTVSARRFAVTFICLDGVTWIEIARTAAQT